MNFFISIDSFRADIAAGHEYLDIATDEYICNRIHFSRQKTGYGFKYFMICPKCGSRHTELYYHKEQFICRNCYPFNIYKRIQNCTKGGSKYIGYRMERYAIDHDIEIKNFPFNCIDYDKPEGVKTSVWIKNITILQALENMRYQALAYNKSWSSKVVKSVLNWNNLYLYLFDLSDLLDRRNRIPWDAGIYL